MSQYDLNSLRELPLLRPPQDRWSAVAQTLDQQSRIERRPYAKWLGLAAAAGILLALWLPRTEQQPVPAPSTALATAEAVETQRWVAASQVLENRLREVRANSVSYRGEHAAILSELEDRVAGVDWQLELPLSPLEKQELWQQRTTLLRDLVAVETSNWFRQYQPDQLQGSPVRTLNRPRSVPVAYQL